jgi:predicted RNase H-like HicB family nuclease
MRATRRGVALAKAMSESLRFTVIYEDAGDGWTMARIAEVSEIITQGATVEEARRMVQSALRDWLEFYVRDQSGGAVEVPPGARKELLELTIAA